MANFSGKVVAQPTTLKAAFWQFSLGNLSCLWPGKFIKGRIAIVKIRG